MSDSEIELHPVVRVCEFRDGIEWSPAKFHEWTKIQRCPFGDGSAIEWVMCEVDCEEPHRIRFADANAPISPHGEQDSKEIP